MFSLKSLRVLLRPYSHPYFQNQKAFMFKSIFFRPSSILYFSSSPKQDYSSIEFQVFGKVQGVYFRQHTHEMAQKLGLVGWVENSKDGTVVGALQGPLDKITEMQNWLKTEGSPDSRIDKCVFKNDKKVPKLEFEEFKVRR